MGSLQFGVPTSSASPHGCSSALSDFIFVRCSLLSIIVHLCLYLFRFSIMFCFTCSGHLAIGMLVAVLEFYSVEWRDSFHSPPLNLRLSNRVFVFYPPDRPRRRAIHERPYPPVCPHRRAARTHLYPPDHSHYRAMSTHLYPPNRPRCRATSTRLYPPDRPLCRATSTCRTHPTIPTHDTRCPRTSLTRSWEPHRLRLPV